MLFIQIYDLSQRQNYSFFFCFSYVDKIDETELKSKEVNAVSDLLSALKLLCNQVNVQPTFGTEITHR